MEFIIEKAKDLRAFIYYQPIGWLIFEAVVMLVIWTIAMLLLRGKPKRVTATAGAVMSLLLIISLTLVRHFSEEGFEINLIPLSSFYLAVEKPYYYRSMQLNIMLFLPLGLSLPFALPEKLRAKPVLTIGFAIILSVIIECIQCAFKIGMCEIDDVIMNTLGAAIGTGSYLLVTMIRRKTNKRNNSTNPE